MKSKLDRLLDSLDPSVTSDETGNRINHALNTFPLEKGRITDWDEFKDWIARFICHAENTLFKVKSRREAHPDYDWNHAYRLLQEVYGRNGEKKAFEMARKGVEGGVYAVLKALAKQLVNEYSQNEIAAKTHTFWNQLTVQERLTAGEEFLAKYGHLLPSEMTEGSGARIRANLPQALIKFPELLQKLRRSVR